jgi:hypothetical protein
MESPTLREAPAAPAPDGWRETEARRRGLAREQNDRIARLDRSPGADPRVWFRCECSEGCATRISLTLGTYESVRSHPRRYVIAPDHENPEVEAVIAGDDWHAVVETLAGRASFIAEATDPRRRASFEEAGRAKARHDETRANIR